MVAVLPRIVTPEVRSIWGGGGDDWFDVSPRRRKPLRQVDRSQDRQRENNWRRDWDDFDNGQSRFRDSRKELNDYDDRFYYSDRYQDRKGIALGGQRDVNTREEVVERRGSGGQQKVLCRAAICVLTIESRQGQNANLAADRTSQQLATIPSSNETAIGSNFKRFVTFYLTNFPAQLSNFYLRKGFEVCGMLEDVVVPNVTFMGNFMVLFDIPMLKM